MKFILASILKLLGPLHNSLTFQRLPSAGLLHVHPLQTVWDLANDSCSVTIHILLLTSLKFPSFQCFLLSYSHSDRPKSYFCFIPRWHCCFVLGLHSLFVQVSLERWLPLLLRTEYLVSSASKVFTQHPMPTHHLQKLLSMNELVIIQSLHSFSHYPNSFC